MIRTLVVDDHCLFRAGVVQSLGFREGIEVVGEAASGAEAVELVKTSAADIVLLDISMPGGGIETARLICQLPNPPRVVMLTVSQHDDDIVSALDAGAVGYITKGITGPELAAAVRSVVQGNSFISPNLALGVVSKMRRKTQTNGLSILSNEEERTLRLVASGMSNREIGDKLGVQEAVIKYRMTRVMRKLNVKNRVEAALVALNQPRGSAD